MAWIYLAESEELPKPWSLGSDLSPIASLNGMPKPFCFQEWRKGKLALRQSGTMSEHSKAKCCQESISSQEDSHARTLALQELEKAWTGSAPDYSVKQFDLFENVDLSSYSSKMCQESEDMCLASGASLRRLATLAAMGSLVLRQLEQTTSGTDGGFWPTPSASEGGRQKSASSGARIRPSLGMMAKKNLWTTPTKSDHAMRRPSANWKGNKEDLQTKAGGQLNPMWVEWLMGYQIGWTELSAWVMPWFRCKPGKRLKS